jgi:DNA-binding NarL/FixJ family response regulator
LLISINDDEKDVVQLIRVVIVDDRAEIRRCLWRRLELEPDIEVLAEALDGQEAFEKVMALKPDVVVMDVKMPVLDGISATALLRRNRLETRIIILSIYDDVLTRQAALLSGASAFVEKHRFSALLGAIRQSVKFSEQRIINS